MMACMRPERELPYPVQTRHRNLTHSATVSAACWARRTPVYYPHNGASHQVVLSAWNKESTSRVSISAHVPASAEAGYLESACNDKNHDKTWR